MTAAIWRKWSRHVDWPLSFILAYTIWHAWHIAVAIACLMIAEQVIYYLLLEQHHEIHQATNTEESWLDASRPSSNE